jgi:hypothetical protein
MTLNLVNSSAIRAVGYDGHTLTVEFHSGRIYNVHGDFRRLSALVHISPDSKCDSPGKDAFHRVPITDSPSIQNVTVRASRFCFHQIR